MKGAGNLGVTASLETAASRPVVRGPDGKFRPGSGRPPARRPEAYRLGNLNASKNPWVTFWNRRALKPEHRWALALVRDYVPSLVVDKGGEDAVSFAQKRVMELAGVARVCWALAMAAGDLEAVARFIGAERSALESIGLERRAKPLPALNELLAAKAPDPPAAAIARRPGSSAATGALSRP